MTRVVIFGGTTEGRKLCQFSAEHAISVRYCVATADGALQVEAMPNISVNVGRLSSDEMKSLIDKEKPALVVDATHPYAIEASKNIAAACLQNGIKMLKVARDSANEQGCNCFNSIDSLICWLKEQTGNIFVTTGTNDAALFTALPDFKNRVWLRILPSIESLRICLEAGYRPDRLVCMQGPVTEELNKALFAAANAKILVTKNSGKEGGFSEKVRAAESLGMVTAVLINPAEASGVSIDEASKLLMELKI